MIKHYLLRGLFLLTSLLFSGSVLAQTNPTAQSIPYSQDFSGLAHSATAYPSGWQGWTVATLPTGSFNTGGPTADRSLVPSSTASANSGNVHNYNGKIGFLNTGSLDLALVTAINSSGKVGISVSYDVMTIRNPYDGGSNTRINEVTLQYRVGVSGTWTTLTGIEYQNNTTLQTGAVTTPQNTQSKSITLPSACDNQPVVQVRWVSRQVSGGGSRPSFAIDNISITASAAPPTISFIPTSPSLNFGNVQVSSTSAEQTYLVYGSFLLDTIHITAPATHLISLSTGSGFTNSISLVPTSGTVAPTTIYCRFTPSVAGLVNDTLHHNSTGASEQKVPVSGTGTVCSPVTISPAGPILLCDGATQTLTATAGASYLWSTSETTQSITVSTAGSYTVTVDDGAGCTVTSSATVVNTANFGLTGDLYSENFGTSPATTPVNSYTGWQNNGIFTYSSTSPTQTDVRNTVPSTGYGIASGLANVFFTASAARNFNISGINTLGYTGLTLSYGLLQSDTAQAPMTVEVSTDGINYTPLSTTPAPNSGWNFYTISSGIPATANLRIRFSRTASPSQFRLDDVRISGTTTQAIIASTTTNAICGANPVRLVSNFPATNLWSTSATTRAIDVSTAGSYSVLVTDANGCTQTSNTITLTTTTPPSHTISTTDPSCYGGNNGAISFTVTDGTAPYEYSVNGGGTYTSTNPVTGLGAGNYSTIVRDVNGCTSIASSATLIQPAQITFTAGFTPVTCIGGNDGTITLSGEAGGAGGPYEFSIDNGGSWQTSGNYTGLSAGTYATLVKDAIGCTSAVTSVTVTTVPVTYTLSATAGTGGQISPAGTTSADCGSSLTYTFTPDPCYQVADVIVDGTPLGALPDYTFTNITTNHTIDVQFSLIPYTVTASAGTGGSISPNGSVTVNCGGSVGFTITPDPGYVIDDVLVNGGSIGPVANYLFTNVTSDQTIAASFVPCASPALANAGNDTTVCAGTNMTLSGSIGGSASTGTWSSSGTGSFNPSTDFATAITYTPSPADSLAGTVTLTLTTNDPDGPGGCPAVSDQVVLNIAPIPAVSISGNASFCTGGFTTLTASVTSGGPAVTYDWQLNGTSIPLATNPSYDANAPGNYTVIVTNAGGCSASSTILPVSEFTPPATPVITAGGPTTFCNGGSVDLTSSYTGGNSWSTGATTDAITVTNSGSYTVTYTDVNGCTATSLPTNVTVNTPVATITAGGPTTFCAGDSVLLSANPSSAYLWSTGATTADIYASSSGNYTVTITDGNGCTAISAPVSVTVNTFGFTGVFFTENMGVPTANTDVNVYTNFQNQNVISYSSTTTPQTQIRSTTASTGYTGSSGGGNAFMGFSGLGNDRNLIISGINASNYTGITLKFGLLRTDAGASMVVETSTDGISWNPLTITQPPVNNQWTLTTASGSIPATDNLRLRFRKSSPTTTQFRIDDIQLSGTTNQVDITAQGPTTFCDGRFLSLLSNVPTGNSWSNFDIAQATFAFFAGSYYTVVTDINGCTSASDTITTSTIPNPSVTITTTDPTCFTGTNGQATAEGYGTSLTYDYSWSTNPVQLNDTAFNLAAGSYTVTVTDASGCTVTGTAVINDPAPILVDAPATNVSCFGNCDGSILANALTGIAPYSYTWDTVNTNIGNQFNIEVAVKTAAHPFFGQGNANGYTINGIEGRSLTLVRGVTYYFNVNALGSPFIISTDSVGGNYLAEVLDGVVNSRVETGTLLFTPNNTHPSLLYYASGAQSRMGYRLNIVDGPSGNQLTGLCPGVYTVQVIDGNGCTGNTTTYVSEPPLLQAPAITPDSAIEGATVVITGTGFSGATGVSFNGTPAVFTVDNDNQITVTVPTGATTGPVTVSANTCTSTIPGTFTVLPTGTTLQLTLFIQGYYTGGNTMNSPLVNSGISMNPTDCDTITVCLMDETTYTEVSCAQAILQTDGNATLTFNSTGNFYLKITHRNSVQTWSANPITFSGGTLAYDFSTDSTQAYGGNMVEVEPNTWALWSADVNQDELIESSDYSEIENDSQGFLFGYVTTDVTGDGLVESADYSLVENNSQLFIFSQHP